MPNYHGTRQFLWMWNKSVLGLPPVVAPVLTLPVYSAALNAVSSGTRNARVLVIGDGSSAGIGSNNGAAGYITSGWPALLAASLNGGYDFTHGNRSYGVATANGAVDPRLAVGAGWSQVSTSLFTFGGDGFRSNTTGNIITFTPSKTFDTIDIYYSKQAAGNASGLTVNVDGGAALATINTLNAADQYVKQTITCTRGTHIVNIVSGSGTNVVFGIHTYDSVQKRVEVLNASFQGDDSTTQNSASNPWSPINANALAAIAPDLVIIDLAVDSISSGIITSQYQADVTAIATACRTAGADVVLLTGNSVDPQGSGASNQDAFAAAIRTISTNNNIPIVDIYTQWGSYASRQSTWMYNSRYANAAGHSIKNQWLTAVLPVAAPVAPHAPIIVTNPAITGSLTAGDTLTCSDGAYNALPTSVTITRQWYLDNTLLAGVTGTSYISSTDDIGKVPKCLVTASNGVGTPVQYTAVASGAVTAVSVPGVSYLMDADGSRLTDSDGSYLYEAA